MSCLHGRACPSLQMGGLFRTCDRDPCLIRAGEPEEDVLGPVLLADIRGNQRAVRNPDG